MFRILTSLFIILFQTPNPFLFIMDFVNNEKVLVEN